MFRPPAFRRVPDRDLLPWWHPHLLLRGLWNLAFSLALGAAIGAIMTELAAQMAARLLGAGLGIGSDNWQDWAGFLRPLGWLLGCFVAFVAYMSYRMDDKTDA